MAKTLALVDDDELDDDLIADETTEDDDALPFDATRFGDAELDAYPLDGCAVATRGGGEDYPFAGQSVWLLPYSPGGLESAIVELITLVGKMQGAEDAAAMADSDVGATFKRVRRGLSRVVAGWDACDPNTGEPYGQPYGNPAVWDDAPTALMYYVMGVVRTGEVPGDRPNASTRGRGGRGTRRSSAKATRSTNAARRRA